MISRLSAAFKKRARGLEADARRACYGTIVSALAATANSMMCRSPISAAALARTSAAPAGSAKGTSAPRTIAIGKLSLVFTTFYIATSVPIAVEVPTI